MVVNPLADPALRPSRDATFSHDATDCHDRIRHRQIPPVICLVQYCFWIEGVDIVVLIVSLLPRLTIAKAIDGFPLPSIECSIDVGFNGVSLSDLDTLVKIW